MVLRCLLVSLVASLGFDLPTGQDVTSWTMSGKTWVSDRAVDLSAMGAEASGWLGINDPTMKSNPAALPATEVVVVAPTEVTEAMPADLAFDSIGEGMALAFQDDLSTARAEEIVPAPADEAVVVMIVTTEPLCQPVEEGLTMAFPAADADATTEEMDQSAVVQSDSAERFSSAVRLTRDAVQAWASLVQTVGNDASLTR